MYIILGSGTAGYYAANQLKNMGHQFTLVDIKPERTEALREMGFERVVEGDITSPDLLKKIHVESAKGLLVLTTDPDLNMRAAKAIRGISKEVPIILCTNRMPPRISKAFKSTISFIPAPRWPIWPSEALKS